MNDEMPAVADTILKSTCVISLTPEGSSDIEAVAIAGNRIMRLLHKSEIEQYTGPKTKVVDLGSRPIMPGFVDPHAHIEVACRSSFRVVDCRAPMCPSIDHVVAKLADQAAKLPKGEWVVGQANLFFDRKLSEGRFPTRAELDRVSRDHPVAVRAGGHLSILNSKALAVVGIDRNYTPPAHSITGMPQVERDDTGEPTGVVKEMDSLLPFSSMTGAELRTALKNEIPKLFTQFGVTAIGEISETITGLQIMDEMAASGELPVAVRVYLWAPGTISFQDIKKWKEKVSPRAPKEHFRIQGVKMFADGGFSARSAAVKEPYLVCGCRGGHSFRGDVALNSENIRQGLEASWSADLQLAVHANGDRAQEWVCREIIKLGGAPAGIAHSRIEHAGNLLPSGATADLWASAGIIPVPQPVFLYTFGEYFPDYLGDYGKMGRFHFASLLKQGWRISGSSDVWVGSESEATNPLFSVWCCLKRQTYSGAYLDTDQAITIEQALKMHTIDAAAVLGEEDVRGSLAPGKFADVIVLDRDPRAVAIDEIRQIKVDHVYACGREVFSRNQVSERGLNAN